MESKTAELKENLKMLIALQDKDSAVDKLKQRTQAIPLNIEEQNNLLSQFKSDFEDTKKRLTQLQLQRKEKELELESKENEIRKHGGELNAIKTNEAYRALLSEIDRCKAEKTALEDTILNIMEETEREAASIKDKENMFKQKEAEVKTLISSLEGEQAKLNADIAAAENERNEFATHIPADLLKHYEYIRAARSGFAIVPVEGENCSGCHFTLRPQEINDVFKGQQLVFCDSCSRILYKK